MQARQASTMGLALQSREEAGTQSPALRGADDGPGMMGNGPRMMGV